jgi:predicted RNA-binding Zn-ribbon protein involved in translation (DUF1610 family)
MYCTPTETLTARKVHLCMSCGERVNPGDQYMRWRCYDDGEVGTVKMHPECYAMHCADAEPHGPWEFTPYSHERPAPDQSRAAICSGVAR